MAIRIGIDDVSRSFGPVRALDRIRLEIKAGEFFTLLGSSGSGKSTLLNLVGGFDRPTSGRVLFDDSDVTDRPANRRPVNTVFQDLALFPHMSVAANVGYGLRVRGTARAEIDRRVASALALVDLDGFEARNVNLLSGGQRQRVALARALIMEPGILLLDEPLTGLDERLRQQMRDEFGRLHRRTGATFVLVTHNQDEALTLSDRMAIMHLGRIEQVGAPADFFEAPANAFVARFVGMDTILTPERIDRAGAETAAWIAGQRIVVDRVVGAADAGVLAVRPDKTRLVRENEAPRSVALTVRDVQFRGLHHDVRLSFADGQALVATVGADSGERLPDPGSSVRVRFDTGATILIPDHP